MLPQCLLLTVSTELLICRLLHLPQVLPLVSGLNPSSDIGTAHDRCLADRKQFPLPAKDFACGLVPPRS